MAYRGNVSVIQLVHIVSFVRSGFVLSERNKEKSETMRNKFYTTLRMTHTILLHKINISSRILIIGHPIPHIIRTG